MKPRWLLTALLVAAAAIAVVAIAFGQGASDPPGPVGVFPSPGLRTAAPSAEISFRGIPAGDVGEVTVTGSRTGEHAGRLIAHSDGQGASFVPSDDFRAGERVTVRTGLDVTGGSDGDFSFRTTGR